MDALTALAIAFVVIAVVSAAILWTQVRAEHDRNRDALRGRRRPF